MRTSVKITERRQEINVELKITTKVVAMPSPRAETAVVVTASSGHNPEADKVRDSLSTAP